MNETPAVYSASNATLLETVLVKGDLKDLNPTQRLSYYRQVCESVGLNPLTRPFDYITLNGKLTLYAKRDAADQLRSKHQISIDPPAIQYIEGMVIVTITARNPQGRTDSDLGVVPIENLKGDARANAILKAITKAKRRVTLSMCGLGWLDETEVETIPDARPVQVSDQGEIVDAKPVEPPQPPKPAPSKRDLLLRLGEAENAFEKAGLTWKHPKPPEDMNEQELANRIVEMRAEYRRPRE